MNEHVHEQHPVRLVVADDYHRNRWTVFFRLILFIPHGIWFSLWTIWIVITGFLNWLISLFTGKPPGWFHRLMCSYVRYQAHLNAYLYLVGNPYPGFAGEEGEYPVDIELPAEPVKQPRWTILIRGLLVLPALLVGGGVPSSVGANFSSSGGIFKFRGVGTGGGSILFVSGFLGWF